VHKDTTLRQHNVEALRTGLEQGIAQQLSRSLLLVTDSLAKRVVLIPSLDSIARTCIICRKAEQSTAPEHDMDPSKMPRTIRQSEVSNDD
jgi:hypothetical protein